MKGSLRRLILIIFIIALAYLGYYLYTKSIVDLTTPSDPPAFSVSYPYSYSISNPLGILDIDKEIKTDIDNIKSAGFEGVKINYHFRQDNNISDKITNLAAKNGLYPIGQINGSDEKPKDRAFTNSELVDWDKFARTVVRENKNRIYFWEVWNEPCMTELFRYGTPAEYLELLQRTQKIIKEENPAAKVIVTADYTDAEAETFTNEFMALGGAQYLDYLSFHPYNAIDPNARYNLAETITQEIELAKKYNKPLWITEVGTPDSDSNEAWQAEIALTLFQAAHDNNIPIVWFYWSDRRVAAVDGKSGWGLVRDDNSFKPAYDNLKSFIGKVDR